MIGLLFIVWGIQLFAQDTLPGVTVISYNYKYLKSINDTNAAQPVKMLQKHSANYDIKSSEFYEEEYYEYIISFNIPKGEIHRLANPTKEPLEIIEVQSGDYLGEDDIVRIKDLYGRG